MITLAVRFGKETRIDANNYVRESNAWKTGVPACHGKQASRLLLQPRQAGKPVCHDNRDRLSSGSAKKS
jgi:hypothetical protein